jgi:hypothetical protein
MPAMVAMPMFIKTLAHVVETTGKRHFRQVPDVHEVVSHANALYNCDGVNS